MNTILIVDDKASVRLLLKEYLTEQGFRAITAENGRIALIAARQEKPDLILLDIMMPEMDGFQFLTHYRRENRTPVIIITAKEEETDAVIGLELGADDYVIKPFRMRELTARVRAVLRRGATAVSAPERLRAGDLVIDKTSREVFVADQPVKLTVTEFDLLAILMGSPGRAFTRLELLEQLQGFALEGTERTINVHIRNLRAKIEPESANPIYVETVFGIGYRIAKQQS